MKLIIDIPEYLYDAIMVNTFGIFSNAPCEVIRNGTPLPKGHGDLKDVERLYADMSEMEEIARQRVIDTHSYSPCYMQYVAQLNERTAFKEMLYDAPTVIEADREAENDSDS